MGKKILVVEDERNIVDILTFRPSAAWASASAKGSLKGSKNSSWSR